MSDLVEKVAKEINALYHGCPNNSWIQWEKEARAAIAVVLGDQYEAYGNANTYDAPKFLREYARENGIDLKE